MKKVVEKWCQLYFSLSYVHGEKWWGKMVSTLFFFKFKLIFDIETIGESFDELDKTTQLEFML
ncbi:hypothetical protein COW09_01670 [bacterium (Candidatus Moisslbacteria) CG12_big_fil_rev_8_21_14_0_65_36_11]|nr:MAG: hypothetical protein COW09_01670 [bacterium (Candidatus Moisslbacteria) CG12_big_fil_rev_8_21_14_0_65_36_11]